MYTGISRWSSRAYIPWSQQSSTAVGSVWSGSLRKILWTFGDTAAPAECRLPVCGCGQTVPGEYFRREAHSWAASEGVGGNEERHWRSMWRADYNGCSEAGEDSNGFEEEEQRKGWWADSKGGGDTTATTTARGIQISETTIILKLIFVSECK